MKYALLNSLSVMTSIENFIGSFPAKVEKFIKYFITYEGYKEVITGLKNTMTIAVLGLVIGILIGTLIAVIRVLPKNNMMPKSGKKIMRVLSYIRSYVIPKLLDGFCTIYVGIFRGTPIIVQLLVFYYVMLPILGIMMTPVNVSICVFGLNSGAYISEIMRGGILSVDPGQMEGGRSVGMSYSATMLRVVIPQAVKNILPTMGNEFIALIKETSVVSFVGATDLCIAFSYIGSNSYEFMVPYLVMAIIYIVIVMIITILIKILERWLRKSDRGR